MIRIDKTLCRRCYACIAQCAYNFIIGKDEDGYPKGRNDFGDHCINCFHCVAVCPVSALSHTKLSPRNCLPIEEILSISTEQAAQFLKSRRSLRSFTGETVSRKILMQLLDITRWAPTAKNLQSVGWLIIESRDKVREIAAHIIDWLKKENIEQDIVSSWDKGNDMVLRGAPHLIIAYSDAERFWSPVDSAIALTYLEFAAKAYNLGACWAGYFTRAAALYSPLREFLNLPDSHQIFGAMMIGYTKYDMTRIPGRNELNITWG